MHPCIDTNQFKKVFFLQFFAYASMSHYSEGSKKNLTVKLLILCKNWSILSDANNSFVPHLLYSHRNCTKTWISLCGFWSKRDFPTLWPVGKYRLDLISDEPQKNIGQDICKKYWQGLVGDKPQKILAKIFAKKLAGSHRWWVQTDRKWLWAGRSGYGCSYSVQLLEACSPVEVVWTGRGVGVVLCKRIGCFLLQSISSLNLVFGVVNRGFQLFWNNKDYLMASFFCNKSLWFCSQNG